MRQVYIFFKIFNARQCWFPHFVRITNMNLFCKSVIKNKKKIMFTTLTKQMKNQTNFRKVEENMDLSHIYLAVLDIWVFRAKVLLCISWKIAWVSCSVTRQKFALFQSNCNICHYRTRAILLHFLYVSKTVSSILQKKRDLFWSIPFLCVMKTISYVHMMKYFKHFQYYFLDQYCSKPPENVSFVCTF